MEPSWQFWIDVGGTFTDVLARAPEGGLRRHKLLSSGITPGVLSAGSTAACVIDPARRADPARFWNGYRLRLVGARGEAAAEEVVADFRAAAGELELRRPLAVNPAAGQSYELVGDEDAPLLGMRYLLGLGLGDPFPVGMVKLGTTKGTNALLTRCGALCALVTTRGFADLLRIGYQNRPRLFDLTIRKPVPLFAGAFEVDERVAADGTVLRAPDIEQVRRLLREVRRQGIQSLAICLLHAYRFPEHEILIESVAREIGFIDVSRSSAVAPFIKMVSRGDTTVVDAYLNPVLRSYVERLERGLAVGGSSSPIELRLLTSAGGLVSPSAYRGKDSILSGPAGGVVGFSRVALAAGFPRSIGVDMGGTSTDVSRYDGAYEREYETEKAGVRIVAPMMAIETVAAGGGSLCWFDGVRLCVGPDSAGADPGPACYGRGGPLALTDINLFLRRLLPDDFPFPLDEAAVTERLEQLRTAIRQASGREYDLWDLAEGMWKVANSRMAQAIRSISIAKGYHPRDYVLVPFGGAAGQHACALAEELDMSRILCHPDAGLLSAYGIGLADVTRHRAQGWYRRGDGPMSAELAAAWQRLAEEAVREVAQEGVAPERISVARSLDMRYAGTDVPLSVPEPSDGDFDAAFAQQHRRLYGYVHEQRPVEVVALRVEATGRAAETLASSSRVAGCSAVPHDVVSVYFQGRQLPTSVHRRNDLAPGHRLAAPAIILEETSTTVVDPGWEAEVLSDGALLLSRSADERPMTRQEHLAAAFPGTAAVPSPPSATVMDPVSLEIFHNHFAAIAEQMGITLRNTSSSVNVKERLDFSCALFTSQGDLVVNAPHIPVHLGAMSDTVRQMIMDHPAPRPGDVYVTNDPFRGGSHLPDITVVTPVCDPVAGRLLFFVASRAHHAEIGGITPGSMPPSSCSLAEEGVLIRDFVLVAAGSPRLDEFRALLSAGPYPSRCVDDNIHDVSAQIAANQQGVRQLLQLVARHGWASVEAAMRHIQRAADQKMRGALRCLRDGVRKFVDFLDDGSKIAVTIHLRDGTARFDFTGTSPVLDGNLNANQAIVTAAVMYCLRCLINEDIPLNQGVLGPVEIHIPECLLRPPQRERPADCAAVAGGNVETSQRVVDVVLGALGLAAASQGTMNNLLFGDGRFGYYETICGGAGATPFGPGADAVHTHMTNTRLTDPEVLEYRYPVRLREFRRRSDSAGAGRHRGGEGVVRRIEFLRELSVSVLSQRRGPYAPYGIAGGGPGGLGRNTLHRASGTLERLPGIAQCTVYPGDILTIETPGGGGWGISDGCGNGHLSAADAPE